MGPSCGGPHLTIKTYKCLMINECLMIHLKFLFSRRTRDSISVQYIANVECRPTLIIVMHVIRLTVERHSHAQRKKQGAQQTPTRARQNKPFEDPNKEASKTKHAVLLQAGHGACTSRLRGCTLPALLPPEQTEFVRGTKPAPARQSPGNTRCG